MDFLRHTLETNQSPFEAGNLSLRFDITQDFPFTPRPAAPLEAVFYIIPARDSTNSLGLSRENGALALFSQRVFYVVDPFSKSLAVWSRLNFDPFWTVEEPAPAGERDVLPTGVNIAAVP